MNSAELQVKLDATQATVSQLESLLNTSTGNADELLDLEIKAGAAKAVAARLQEQIELAKADEKRRQDEKIKKAALKRMPEIEAEYKTRIEQLVAKVNKHAQELDPLLEGILDDWKTLSILNAEYINEFQNGNNGAKPDVMERLWRKDQLIPGDIKVPKDTHSLFAVANFGLWLAFNEKLNGDFTLNHVLMTLVGSTNPLGLRYADDEAA